MMSRKHYRAIAEAIKKHNDGNDNINIEVVSELADFLKQDNHKFNEVKFLTHRVIHLCF